MKASHLGFFGLSLLAAIPAHAEMNYSFIGFTGVFSHRQQSAGSRALGEICWSRAIMPDGTVCNPALLGNLDDGFLQAKLYTMNGYETASTVYKLLFQPLTTDSIKDLFQNDGVHRGEMNPQIAFFVPHFSFQFNPYRTAFVTEVHNPNLPVVGIHAIMEQSFEVGTGASLAALSGMLRDFSVGMKTRISNRKYINQDLTLASVAVLPPDQILDVQHSTQVFNDFSASWTRSVGHLNPLITLSYTDLNLGDHAGGSEDPDFNLGVGIAPKFGPGILSAGFDWIGIFSEGNTVRPHFRFGTSYQYGFFELLGGLSSSGINNFGTTSKTASIGTQFGFSNIQLAVTYEISMPDVVIDQGQSNYYDTQISTELAIRI